MSEEYHTSPYSLEQDNYAGSVNPLPYIEASSNTSLQSSNTSPFSQSAQPEISRSKTSLLAAEHQVGKVLREYKSEAPMLTSLGCSSALGGALLLILVAFAWQQGLFIRIFMPLAGFSLLVYGVSRSWAGLWGGIASGLRNMRLFLCTDGVMCIKWGRVRTMRWDQMAGIQKSIIPGEISRLAKQPGPGRTRISASPYAILQLILYPNEGEPLKLDRGFLGFEAFAGEIEQEVKQRHLPAAIAAYEAGQTVNFGAINVTPQGLSLENVQKELPWEKLKGVGESRGDIIIRGSETASVWASIDVSEILNLCVFFPLINYIWTKRLKEISGEQNPLSDQPPAEDLSQQSEWHEYE